MITNKFRNTVNIDIVEMNMYTKMYSAPGFTFLVQDKLLFRKQYWIVSLSVFVTPQIDILAIAQYRVDSVLHQRTIPNLFKDACQFGLLELVTDMTLFYTCRKSIDRPFRMRFDYSLFDPPTI